MPDLRAELRELERRQLAHQRRQNSRGSSRSGSRGGSRSGSRNVLANFYQRSKPDMP